VILRDKEIRSALHRHLMKRRPQPLKILEEVSIHNGNAIADLVAFYDEMHCFEIKGETDNIRRITRQAIHYNHAFSKISLVTTANHLRWCEQHSPTFWGLVHAYWDAGVVKLRYVRAAAHNPVFDKQKAFMMLWKDELASIANNVAAIAVKSSYTREDIAKRLSESLKKAQTLDSIRNALLVRKRLELIDKKRDVTS